MENANSKIPVYAREYKREYQFIRGINKDFKYLINKLDNLNNGLFESKLVDRIKFNMKRFLRGQEKGKLKDISDLRLPFDEVNNLIYINEHFGYYKLRWDAFDDNKKPYPGFKEIYDIFKLFFDQIKYDNDDDDDDFFSDNECVIDFHLSDSDNDNYNVNDNDNDSDSDSDNDNDNDSDSDSDNDNYNVNDNDNDSDSDSDSNNYNYNYNYSDSDSVSDSVSEFYKFFDCGDHCFI